MTKPTPTRRLAAVLAVLLTASLALPAAGGDLRGGDLVTLAKRFAKFADDLPPAAQLGMTKITAYEEHPQFVYVRGETAGGDRGVVFCKPDTFVIDHRRAKGGEVWKLAGQAGVTCQRLLPDAAGRFLHVIHVGERGAAGPKADVAMSKGTATLKLTTGDRTFTLALPAEADAPGTIAVAQTGGKELLPQRLLPAGIMPHGENGVRMLSRWDGAYRGGRRPGWDTGRPASELVAAVTSGRVKPGRAVVLGCGTGTNAIYLAQKGFDVTALDVAPTALARARDKADKAKVNVRWLVTDVLAPPALGTFDFIFDRGCYHGVRRVSATGFVKTVNALSKPGTHMFIIAGNANEARHYGPPRVDETHLVGDFSKTWDFVSLQEIRLDGRTENTKSSAWAWAVLIRRRPDK